jgi:Lon protease-like protein
VALVERCLRDGTPFGAMLIRNGVEALGPLPEPFPVGCAAHITEVARLPAGRLNVRAVGGERVRLRHARSDAPYLIGQVEWYPLAAGDPAVAAAGERRLRAWLGRYLSVLAAASETQEDLSPGRLPVDPRALAYLAASLLPVPASAKQELLEEPDLGSLLSDVAAAYRRELPVLETLIDQANVITPGAFSRN